MKKFYNVLWCILVAAWIVVVCGVIVWLRTRFDLWYFNWLIKQ